ncbi:MAG: bifunctional glycoside hydrolase 114/ polysaccharide deacetylase family protein [Burkholderiaceae bacterium]
MCLAAGRATASAQRRAPEEPPILLACLLHALPLLLALLATPFAAAQDVVGGSTPAFAFFYGPNPPLAELQAFDRVVLEPEHAPEPARLPRHARWYAYVSVVEVAPARAWLRDVPADWLRGDNPVWGSRLIDQAAPGWAEFFERRLIAPLWQQGWRGFFLDTLDSYHLYAKTSEARRAQEDALVALVERLHTRFPGIELIVNRGFEILPRLRGKVAAVAAESLYRSWDRAAQTYRDVPAADRDWLLAQLARVRDEHRVPIVVIDYAPLADRAGARAIAARIRAAGFIPWVAVGHHDALGVGDLEVQPRRIALLTDRPDGVDFMHAAGFRFLAAPLGYLGYTIEPVDVKGPLPASLADGRYAGIVAWFSQPVKSLNPRFAAWLSEQVDAGLKVVLMNHPGLDADSAPLRKLGFRAVKAPRGRLTIAAADALVGFETAPPLVAADVVPLAHATGTPLLRLAAEDGTTIDAVGLAPWGGYAFAPYTYVEGALDAGARWVIDPIEFLHRALGAPVFPVPDVTTEAGRRLLFVHIDGDGFPSRAELPGSPFAAEALLREVIARYRIPHTVSVIQGEIAGNGMFRELTPALEDIARRIFAAPHVEIASHSYSHPFYWRALAGTHRDAAYESRALNLVLPGYTFDLQAEIAGSAAYIDARLAPPGKKTRVFLWTGDTVPTDEAVEAADRAGLLNMNGGDTLITRSAPSLTRVAGLGIRRGTGFQVFAPNQNENVYTNRWTGPYYGYQRAIETFELTEAPRRVKPINIYYHTYSASKQASLAALHRVYGWALAQPVVPVYASDYIRKVLDFESLAIARDLRAAQPTWRVRGAGELRTLRLPASASVALAASRNVAGTRPGPDGRYVHLTDADAAVVLAAEDVPPVHVYDAAGWIGAFRRDAAGIRFVLSSYYRPEFTLAHAPGCRVRVDGRDLAPAATAAGLLRYELARHDAAYAPTQSLVDVRCR